MLDEDQQMRNFIEKMPDGTEFIDEHGARRTISNALDAMEIWSSHQDAVKSVKENNAGDLRQMLAAVDKLTENSVRFIRDKADNVKKKMS